jgi:hypothetical protein
MVAAVNDTDAMRDDSNTIDLLNTLLRSELAAVESYRRGIEQLDSTLYHGTLLHCCCSHEDRAEVLRQEILARGGVPVQDSGLWPTVSRFGEFESILFGDSVAISALSRGENDGQDDYRAVLERLEPDVRELVESAIIPEQQRVCSTVCDIQRQIAA